MHDHEDFGLSVLASLAISSWRASPRHALSTTPPTMSNNRVEEMPRLVQLRRPWPAASPGGPAKVVVSRAPMRGLRFGNGPDLASIADAPRGVSPVVRSVGGFVREEIGRAHV